MKKSLVRTLQSAAVLTALLLVASGTMLILEVAPAAEVQNGTVKALGVIALVTVAALLIGMTMSNKK